MSRRKKGLPVHGWLVLDKPVGMTSTQAVAHVKRRLNAQKAGHAGTLDPLATGILPIALGEATKTVSFAVDGVKAYRFTVRWGIETDTDDAEGRPIADSALRPARCEIEAILPRFTGLVSQVPPKFSAIKVGGERAYDLAREGEVVVLEPRDVQIDALHVFAMPDADTTILEAVCGKGTYVRALARDIGRVLGCRGHVIALRRTRVGPFSEADAVTLEAPVPEDSGQPPGEPTEDILHGRLLPVAAALEGMTALNVSPNDTSRLKRGQAILMRGRDAPVMTGPAYVLSRGALIAIGELERGEFRPTRVFNLS